MTRGSDHLKAMQLKESLCRVFQGIDACETSEDGGWWETSRGEAFGAAKLEEMKREIDRIMTGEP